MKHYLLSVLLCCFFPLLLHAQMPEELKALLESGEQNYSTLKELRLAELAADKQVSLARSGYLPTVGASLGYTYVNPVSQVQFPVGPGEYTTLRFQPNNNYNSAITASVNLLDFGRTANQVAIAKLDYEIAKENTAKAKQLLKYNIINTYNSIIYINEAIRVEDYVLSFLTDSRQITEAKIKRGDALEIDQANIQSTYDLELNRKANLENQKQGQLANLMYLTGNPTAAVSSTVFFNNQQPLANTTQAIEMAMQQQPDFILASNQSKRAEQNIHLSRTQLYPTLNVFGSIGYKNGYQPDLDKLVFNQSVGATLNIPLFAAGKTGKTIALSKLQHESSIQSMKSIRDRYQKDIEVALQNINFYTTQSQLIQSQLDYAKRTLSITQSRFSNGVVTQLDVVSASANYQRVNLSMIENQYQLSLSWLNLNQLLGVDL